MSWNKYMFHVRRCKEAFRHLIKHPIDIYETTNQQLSCTHLVSTVSYSFEYTPTSM